jgi:hypothetical protein
MKQNKNTSSVPKKNPIPFFGFVHAENYFKVLTFKLSHFPGNSRGLFDPIFDHF